MYNLYTDRQELFEAKIDVSGASLEQSKCRILVESDNWNLVFNGEINEDGNVKIPIKKLKSLFKEGDTGTIKLEVIADDTYFTPWESEFKINTSKKVVAEIKSQQPETKELIESDVKVKSTVVSQKRDVPSPSNRKIVSDNISTSKSKDYLNEKKKNLKYLKSLTKIFINENVTLNNLHQNKSKITRVINKFITENNITDKNKQFIINGIIKVLASRK
jgi:hypothetical protein